MTLLNTATYGGMLGVACAALFALPVVSHAYFSSDAAAEGNTFAAGTLEIEVDPDSENVVLMEAGAVTATFDISDAGSIAPQYEVTATPTACSGAFMDGVDVVVTNGEVLYEGPFANLSATSTSSGAWEFALTASSTLRAYENDTCEVELTVRAWQQTFSTSTIGGFTDEKTVTLTITAGEDINLGVVLNEVLPNPEGDDGQPGLQGEWIEVYNTGSSAVDLTGWYVKDAADNIMTFSTSTTYNGQVIADVPGSGNEWVVLFVNGEKLNNTGDTLDLYNAAHELQDSYTYMDGTNENDADSDSNNTPNGDNENPGGVETEHQEGKSDARIPDGFGEWIDPEPTAGEPNQVSEDELRALGYTETMIEFLLEQQARARARFETQHALLVEQELETVSETVPVVDPATEPKQVPEGEQTETQNEVPVGGGASTDAQLPEVPTEAEEVLPADVPEEEQVETTEETQAVKEVELVVEQEPEKKDPEPATEPEEQVPEHEPEPAAKEEDTPVTEPTV